MCYLVQFADTDSLDYLHEKLRDEHMYTESGTIYLPFNSVMIDSVNIVTLSGLTVGITDSTIKEVLSPYGTPVQVFRGFHWIGSKLSNGKCYVVFDGQLHRNIPNKIILDEINVLVKYTGQPITCLACGSSYTYI
jgi:hypothetical protein